MGRLESGRLAGQRRLLLPLFRAVVCDGEAQTRRGAHRILVVKSGGLAVAPELRSLLQKGLSLHCCLRVHLDSLHPELDHPSPAYGCASGMLSLFTGLSAPIELLFWLRREARRRPDDDRSPFKCRSVKPTVEPSFFLLP